MAQTAVLHTQCPGCGTFALVANAADPDAEVVCGCCPLDHHHGQAANACPGGHDAEPCPHPDPKACGVHLSGPGNGADCDPAGHGDGSCPAHADGCQGGHCGKGVNGCTVCRPLILSLPPASVHFQLGGDS